MAQCQADPAHSIVVLPFAQLLPVARQQWAQHHPCALVPRFETTWSWAQRLQAFAADDNDLSLDPARDLLVAQRLLQQAGLKQQAQWLAPRVREAALQLAGVAAAQAPAQRMAWAARMQAALQANPVPALEYEQQIALLALAWAGHSAYATDVLFDVITSSDVQALVLVSGLQDDPLLTQLLQTASATRPQWVCQLDALEILRSHLPVLPAARLHMARDLEDLAQRTAACVLQAVQQQHAQAQPQAQPADAAPRSQPTPVALADTDRALTRRIRALLAGQGLALRDEPGWKLSTTVAASHLVALLRACAPQASSDSVLAWLKLLPAAACPGCGNGGNGSNAIANDSGNGGSSEWSASHIQAIESHLRQKGCAQWPGTGFWRGWQHPARALAEAINNWRASLQASRPLALWLQAVQHVLQASGAWAWLAQDAAGQTLLRALHWPHASAAPDTPPRITTLPNAESPWPLDAFMHWITQVLESSRFTPPCAGQAQVAIVPASQLLARPFAAVIMPGCDADRLPAAPDLPGLWTHAQRALLGLPDRSQAQHAQRRMWQSVLAFADLDLLACRSDGDAELLPSPLLLEWQLAQSPDKRRIEQAADPRAQRLIAQNLPAPPQPLGQRLPVQQISASSYDNLRACPYRFFALNQLRLQEVPELDAELEKRDFGIWLHRTLHLFHEQLARSGQAPDASQRPELQAQLDAAAHAAAREQQLDDAAFLPYKLAWNKLRQGYLDWLLGDYLRMQCHYAQGEAWLERPLHEALQAADDNTAAAPARLPPHPVKLVGVIDRIDRCADQTLLLLDYKSGDAQAIKARIQQPAEHVQLPFYAALLAPQAVRSAYLTIGERGQTSLQEQPDATAQAQPLLRRIAHDLADIAAGTPLPALGQGRACDYCAARGLCRRDFRETTA